MIKNLIFDFGGVVITIDQPQAVRRFKEIGLLNAEQQLDPYTQSGIFGDLERGVISAEDFRIRLGEMVGRELKHEECGYAWRGYCGGLPERNLKTLLRLRTEGYRLILLSNTNPYMMEWADSDSFDGNGHPVGYYFDAMYRSFELGFMKPEEIFFRHIIKEENIMPCESLFVDDGLNNVKAAGKLGFHTYCPENGTDWTETIYEYLKR
ncbi:MAG: HAD family phosphatase [Prevotella sp.]|nr:HAD family phosphatase [Prevotella sp.]MDY2702869.1 HAD family phosphatase [Prevotella sp.]